MGRDMSRRSIALGKENIFRCVRKTKGTPRNGTALLAQRLSGSRRSDYRVGSKKEPIASNGISRKIRCVKLSGVCNATPERTIFGAANISGGQCVSKGQKQDR